MKDIKNLLYYKNLICGEMIRGKIEALPYNSNLLKNYKERRAFNYFSEKQTEHYEWAKFEICNEKFVKVNFTNETTKKLINNHVLLDKQDMSNGIHQIVGKGFTKIYDVTNPDELEACMFFIKNFQKKEPYKNQKFDDANFDVIYQSLNLMEKVPELTKSLLIQCSPLSDQNLNKEVIKHHAIVKNETVNVDGYKYAKEEHLKLSNNENLAPKLKEEHKKIATDMDSFLNIIKKYYQ